MDAKISIYDCTCIDLDADLAEAKPLPLLLCYESTHVDCLWLDARNTRHVLYNCNDDATAVRHAFRQKQHHRCDCKARVTGYAGQARDSRHGNCHNNDSSNWFGATPILTRPIPTSRTRSCLLEKCKRICAMQEFKNDLNLVCAG